MKLLRSDIVFKEHPWHISLALSITQCKFTCKNCHTPELQQDIGIELTEIMLREFLVEYQNYIDNVIFMGGYEPDNYSRLVKFLNIIHDYNMKTTLWTGYDEVNPEVLECLDYLKIGRYIEERGTLGSIGSNQRYFVVKTKQEIKINVSK